MFQVSCCCFSFTLLQVKYSSIKYFLWYWSCQGRQQSNTHSSNYHTMSTVNIIYVTVMRRNAVLRLYVTRKHPLQCVLAVFNVFVAFFLMMYDICNENQDWTRPELKKSCWKNHHSKLQAPSSLHPLVDNLIHVFLFSFLSVLISGWKLDGTIAPILLLFFVVMLILDWAVGAAS